MKRAIVTWLIVVLAIAGISAGLGLYKYSQIRADEAAALATPDGELAHGPVPAPRRRRCPNQSSEGGSSTRLLGR